MDGFIISLDQGTTSSRAIRYDMSGEELASASRTLNTEFPKDAWVEQDANEIWQSIYQCLQEVHCPGVKAIAITNQRETTICWDKNSGEPLAPAIVWQCRRTASVCEKLKAAGHEESIREKTGLVLDAYFSGTKIKWMIDNHPVIKEKVASKEAIFGTVDSWLIYNLSKLHSEAKILTEPSNASRTMLLNLNGSWDEDLLKLFGLSEENLATVVPSAGEFCRTKINEEEIPILSVLGDQQASLYGLGCTEKGMAKCTFGTGAFMLSNCGSQLPKAEDGILTTVSWKKNSQIEYALEGSVFMAGALIQWLRDKLKIFDSAGESENLARSVRDSGGVVIVPAFVGLGAPYWDSSARGSILGLTRDSSDAHIAYAALEAVAHQVADLVSCFKGLKELRIDGGMSKNKLFTQMLADFTRLNVDVSPKLEATAFGVAKLAAEQLGSKESFSIGEYSKLTPGLSSAKLSAKRELWVKAVSRSQGWAN